MFKERFRAKLTTLDIKKGMVIEQYSPSLKLIVKSHINEDKKVSNVKVDLVHQKDDTLYKTMFRPDLVQLINNHYYRIIK